MNIDMSARGQILDGTAVAAEIRADVRREVAELRARGGRPPGLAVVLVGDDPASKAYVGSKAKASEEVGIAARSHHLPTETSERDLLRLLDDLNRDGEVDGILVQLPLPSGLGERKILDTIDPAKDVDGFHPINVGRLWLGEETFAPATPAGILELLRRCRIPLKGQRAVVVGRSAIVGKPMAALLLAEHCTVTVCHSRTRDLPSVCREADILVAAIGRATLLGEDCIRDGAVVVDVGINRLDDRAEVERLYPDNPERLEAFDARGWILVGDVDFSRARTRATAITPVPGGVGPLTIAMLLVNTLTASRRRQGLSPEKAG